MSHLDRVKLKQGIITQEQFDKRAVKEDKRKAAKGKMSKKVLKDMTKQELIAIIEELSDN